MHLVKSVRLLEGYFPLTQNVTSCRRSDLGSRSGKRVILDLTSVHADDLFEYAHRHYGDLDSTPISFDDNGGYLSLHPKERPIHKPISNRYDIPSSNRRNRRRAGTSGFGDSDQLSKTGGPAWRARSPGRPPYLRR